MKAIVDCNSFYASCEQVFQPKLRGKPIVVLSNNDGCIIARNDEAKMMSIPMGVPFFQAEEQIRKMGIHVFSSNYILYGDLSRRVMETIASVNPDIEVYSIDEAFLEVEDAWATKINLHDYGQNLRKKVLQHTGIPVSIGIAATKTLAKIANRRSKKDKEKYQGVFILEENNRELVLKETAVADIWGVGYRHAPKLSLIGINNAWDLSLKDEKWAHKNLGGVVGVRLIKELNGVPCKELGHGLDQKKNIASTRSFGKPVKTLSELKEAIATYTARAAEKLRKQNSAASIISVFASSNRRNKNEQYHYESAYINLPFPTHITSELISQASLLTEQIFWTGKSYKKAGVMLSGILPQGSIQQHLFEAPKVDPKKEALSKTVDALNARMGCDKISFVATGVNKDWKMRCESRSPNFTTSWNDIPFVRTKL